MANNNFDSEETNGSKFKNPYNAEINYRYLNSNKHLLSANTSMKINEGRYDYIHNPTTDKNEAVWIITELVYVNFSWKDKKDNNCGFSISFHIKTDEFEDKLNRFLNIPQKQKAWQTYYN